jgi:hypothetical protein
VVAHDRPLGIVAVGALRRNRVNVTSVGLSLDTSLGMRSPINLAAAVLPREADAPVDVRQAAADHNPEDYS